MNNRFEHHRRYCPQCDEDPSKPCRIGERLLSEMAYKMITEESYEEEDEDGEAQEDE